ncbi:MULTISPECIES: PaaI family thioesterase [Bordetella]|uniref:DUF4442 domain-containing protein n=1 Tax=Bordetella pertussis (strain ATCC 9797 / DSM 5571 / CCUG 30873 / LMG 14455 / NCTC 10739 / 18323) TaxID=568706 RepID=A0A0T7CLJ0_BORP1|nr:MULTISPECIES: DUF4442 domain-containing protein [Bordetella]KCV20216.1 PF14539 domain protein [Bordetella pertussis B200]KCV30006.1 PF14539 domain protein [Bordetella bronchiseptica 00-P-2730]KDD54356.1 PF14539 domain protein [Bordetella bronchiseptica OSU553]ANT89273.1 hypothetical protein ADU61_07605 [Bordetella pertussis]AOY24470.1 DUF4442 domain-containing protein [Bordetella pertussis]
MKLQWIERVPPRWRARLLRVGFNLHPAFRATGGRVVEIAADFLHIRIRLPLGRRTRNIVGSMYGGSLFSVTDGAHPTMLMMALGPGVIVWDKAATIRYRKPAYATLYADFRIGRDEIAAIRAELARDHETTRTYSVALSDRHGEVYAVVERTVYIADKAFYKRKTQAGAPARTPLEPAPPGN